jgi:hypothetical protein
VLHIERDGDNWLVAVEALTGTPFSAVTVGRPMSAEEWAK